MSHFSGSSGYPITVANRIQVLESKYQGENFHVFGKGPLLIGHVKVVLPLDHPEPRKRLNFSLGGIRASTFLQNEPAGRY